MMHFSDSIRGRQSSCAFSNEAGVLLSLEKRVVKHAASSLEIIQLIHKE